MSRFKLFGLVAAMAVFTVPFLAASAAQAQATEDDTFGVLSCQFEGLSGHSPIEVPSIEDDVDPPNIINLAELLDVDWGTFMFEGDATCTAKDTASSDSAAAVDDPAKRPTLNPAQNNIRIWASGEFHNLVCGTGHWVGTAEFTDNTNSNLDLSLTAPFGITFAAGNGKMSGSDVDGSITDKAAGTPANVVQSGESSGYVSIIPGAAPAPLGNGDANQGNCVHRGVSSFRVRGAFEATLSGDANDDVDP